MAEPPAPVPSNASEGVKSLRETTKWLVGGVAATAAGVFAGSSLTNLGSLDPFEDWRRLGLAIAGIAIGFGGLAIIVKFAVAVLTVESATFRMVAQAAASDDGDSELKQMATNIERKFKRSFPLDSKSVPELSDKIDELDKNDPRRAQVRAFDAMVMPDVSFLRVRDRFVRLAVWLIPGAFLAALGFGLFAWAANPPAPQAVPTPQGRNITVSVSGPGNSTIDPPPAEPNPCGHGSC